MPSQVKPPKYTEVDPNIAFFAKICANYFIHLFASKMYPFPTFCSAWQAEFPDFVTEVFQRSELDTSIAIGAMTLLHRYKTVYPTAVAYYDEAPRLFIEAYMIAATEMGCPRLMSFWKKVCGDRYSLEQLFAMRVQFRKALLGYVYIDRITFDGFKKYLEPYLNTDDVREFVGVGVEDVVLPRYTKLGSC